MVIRTTVVELARDGTLRLPPAIRRSLRKQNRLSVTRIGTSLVLAPVPEKWTQPSGRVNKYEHGLILRNPKVMFGTPVIAGTRIPVRTIVGYLESGYSPTQIRKEFPFLTIAQIEAAARYHGKQARQTH